MKKMELRKWFVFCGALFIGGAIIVNQICFAEEINISISEEVEKYMILKPPESFDEQKKYIIEKVNLRFKENRVVPQR